MDTTNSVESLSDDAPLLALLEQVLDNKLIVNMSEEQLELARQKFERLRKEPQLLSATLREEGKGQKQVKQSQVDNLMDRLLAGS